LWGFSYFGENEYNGHYNNSVASSSYIGEGVIELFGDGGGGGGGGVEFVPL
jgi:hypothetical protein